MLAWLILALGLYLCLKRHWIVGLLLVLISGRWLAAAIGVLLLVLLTSSPAFRRGRKSRGTGIPKRDISSIGGR